MMWSLWLLAVFVFAVAWLLYWFEDGRGQNLALDYRHKYLRLIERVETLVGLANRIEPVARSAPEVRHLDTYLSHLRMLETLMEAIHGMPAFSTKVATLQAPQFLVGDMTDRFERLAKDLDLVVRGKKKQLKAEPAPLLGCYFCSRPFDVTIFHKVRVKVDGASQDVAACKTCNGKLLAGKKAKVLFFSEDGQTIHWSKAKDYSPSAQYWSINDSEDAAPGVLSTGTHLTLVYSSVTPLSSQSKLD